MHEDERLSKGNVGYLQLEEFAYSVCKTFLFIHGVDRYH